MIATASFSVAWISPTRCSPAGRRLGFISFLLISWILSGYSYSAEVQERPKTNPMVQTSESHRLSILKASRGVAFLATGEAVSVGGRDAGLHPVEWIEIYVLVETPVDAKPFVSYRWNLTTPDGEEFVTALATHSDGKNGKSRASNTIECDLGDPQLRALLDPVRVPKRNGEWQGHVLVLRMSGHVNPGKIVHLNVSFRKGDDMKDDFLFPILLP